MSGASIVSKAVREIVTRFQNCRPHGWCTPEKAAILLDLVAELKPELCVEIGVYGGASLIPIALAVREHQCGRVVGIDPWRTEDVLENMTKPENRAWWSKVPLEQIMESCYTYMKTFGVAGIITLMRTTSRTAVDGFVDGTIGLMHFDGNHSQESAMEDVTLYLPKVKPGGAIVFDDVNWTEAEGPSQQLACQYLLDHGCEKIRECDGGNCWILLKKPGHPAEMGPSN